MGYPNFRNNHAMHGYCIKTNKEGTWKPGYMPLETWIKAETAKNQNTEKLKLPAFGFGMPVGSTSTTPDYSKVFEIGFDLDNVGNEFDYIWNKLKDDKRVTLLYRSQSGNGIRFFMRSSQPLMNRETYHATFLSILDTIPYVKKYIDGSKAYGNNFWFIGRDE